jgi:S1-C subfamily serine protease
VRKLLVAISVAGLALGGVACGGDGDGAASTTGARTPKPQVIVQASDNGFNSARIYDQAAPGVVTIRSVFGDISSGNLLGASAAEGSGFVLNEDGEIVTNAHVVTNGGAGGRAEADEVYVEFSDRSVVPAKILGFDPFVDVALLKVEPDGLDLQPLELGDDRDLAPGQPVAAIGSPFGEQQSLSVGVVSATDRSVQSLTQFQIEGAIQTDASINPGNSGGPLLDAGARVIGINQQIETKSGANDGVGFAVPISAVKRSIEQLRQNGEASYAYIGVSAQALYPQLAERLELDTDHGGLIATVVPGGPADEAGLRGGDGNIIFQAQRLRVGGDVILSVNGREVVEPSDLSEMISALHPGDDATLEVLRDGERIDIEVTLGERPASPNGR